MVKWGKTIQVNARLINTSDGTVVQTASIETTQADDIPGKMRHLANQFVTKGNTNDLSEQSLSIPSKSIHKVDNPLSQIKSAPQIEELYSGIWVLRTSNASLRELNYSKVVLRQNGNKLSGIQYLPNGGKASIEGIVVGERLNLSFYFKDDKSLETGLMMHGIERPTALDVANTRAGIGRAEMKAMAKLSGNGAMLEGDFQMWYADIRPYTYAHNSSVGSVNIYDAGTQTASMKRPPVPVKLILMDK